MKKTKTMDLRGNQYAQVKDRLQEFRIANPNGLIETVPTFQPDGQVLFKARILKDKSDQSSAEATGHSIGKSGGAKEFEKLETIAVGRALALLGYASSGEIASSEEMEEFLAHQQVKKEEMLFAAQERLEECKSLEELKEAWASIPVDAKTAMEPLKEAMKVKLTPPKKKAKTNPPHHEENSL